MIIRDVGFAAALTTHDAECEHHGHRTAAGWGSCKHKGDCYREVATESANQGEREPR